MSTADMLETLLADSATSADEAATQAAEAAEQAAIAAEQAAEAAANASNANENAEAAADAAKIAAANTTTNNSASETGILSQKLSRIIEKVDNYNSVISAYNEHLTNDDNPHQTTATQVGAAITKTYTATIGTNWSGSEAPYNQTVTISGITTDMIPVVDVVLSTDTNTAKNQLKDWCKIGKISMGSNLIVVTCYGSKPTSEIPIQLKVVE